MKKVAWVSGSSRLIHQYADGLTEQRQEEYAYRYLHTANEAADLLLVETYDHIVMEMYLARGSDGKHPSLDKISSSEPIDMGIGLVCLLRTEESANRETPIVAITLLSQGGEQYREIAKQLQADKRTHVHSLSDNHFFETVTFLEQRIR